MSDLIDSDGVTRSRLFTVSTFYRILIALRRRQGKPHVRADIVLRTLWPCSYLIPRLYWGEGVAFIGSAAKPLNSLNVVLRHALAVAARRLARLLQEREGF